MTLSPQEFMPLPLHVLPSGFHRIRHYGLLANGNRRDNRRRRASCCTRHRPTSPLTMRWPRQHQFMCSHCGHAMVVLQVFLRDNPIRAPPAP